MNDLYTTETRRHTTALESYESNNTLAEENCSESNDILVKENRYSLNLVEPITQVADTRGHTTTESVSNLMYLCEPNDTQQ